MASAQTETSQPTPLPEQNWLVNCTNVGTPDRLRCSVTQIVRLKKTGQKLIRVEVIPIQGSQKARMLVGLPHGLFLPDGIKMSVDDGPKTAYQITNADQNGSYCELELNEKQLSALRAGTQLRIDATARTREPVHFKISLEGFTAAEKLMIK